VLLWTDRSNSPLLSACQNPKQAGLIGRHVHTLLFQKEDPMMPGFLKIFDLEVGFILSKYANLRSLFIPVGDIDPDMLINLLSEHTPPTLRRIRIQWDRLDVLFTLYMIPQATLQNLTHLSLSFIDVPPCNKPYWQPLRTTSLQYFSFKWWDYLEKEHISLLTVAFAQRPLSLKALIIDLTYNDHYEERCLDELDAWFCNNQNDSKDSVVISAGLTCGMVANSKIKPVTGSGAGEHKVWGKWGFLTHMYSSYADDRCYDLCEELLPDGRLTIWEEADRALEDRRLWLVSQVDGVAQG
jgi:hypothetical protein